MKISTNALVCALVAIAPATVRAEAPSAKTQNGTITGTHSDEFNQDFFLGIPFARPPVGEHRFEQAQPYDESLEGFKADKYGNSCYWIGTYGDNLGWPVSEDCLQLNVVRPSGYEDKKLPVAVWIHGGGFNWGASMRDVYNLSYPVEQSVKGETPLIAVSINYRLNGFGFLASKELKDSGNLNLGLNDQRLALKWVKENIEAFGGDPSKVTIWGESAGGFSVSLQMLAFEGENDDLFHQGVMESGNALGFQYLAEDEYEKQFANISQQVGCPNMDIKCLKQVSAEKLKDAFNTTSFDPVIDGQFITTWPSDLIKEGKYAKVPVIAGTNTDEGTSFLVGNVNTTEQLTAALKQKYPQMKDATLDKLLKLYPDVPSLGCPFGTGDQFSHNGTLGYQYKRACALGNDMVMAASRRFLTQNMAEHGIKVYSYNWNQSDYGSTPESGTSHFQEVVYVFHNHNNNTQSKAQPIGPDPTGELHKLSELTSRYFMSFMATGDPNNAKLDLAKGSPKWHDYKHAGGSNYYFHHKGCHNEKDNWRSAGIGFINYGMGHQLQN